MYIVQGGQKTGLHFSVDNLVTVSDRKAFYASKTLVEFCVEKV